MVKILIVEDQTMLREFMESFINQQKDMTTVGTTDDASKAPELCRKLKPDLVLMDVVTKNNSSGITYTAQIRREFPNIKIVIMTSFPDITFSEEAKKAGAHSFIDKEMGNEHLLHVIRNTMKGHSIYSGPSTRLPFNAHFTEKEITVIRHVCQGVTRDEIASKMNISESMVKQHISSILDKTGFNSISKFAIYAVSRGIIVPETLDQMPN